MNTDYWCVIADDFTGAGDSAVHFISKDHPVRMVPDASNREYFAAGDYSLVVNSDSRDLSPLEAHDRVCRIAKTLRDLGHRNFFKKIDSTLRGNIVHEIMAVMETLDYRFAVVAPAAPRNRRTLINGRCLVEGVPLPLGKKTDGYSFSPEETRITLLFEKEYPGAVREIGLPLLRGNRDALIAFVKNAVDQGVQIFILDTAEMADLRAAAALSALPSCLFVGASGLAEALGGKSLAGLPGIPRFKRGEMFFMIGSVSPASVRQCRLLTETGQVKELICDSQGAITCPGKETERLMNCFAGISSKDAVLVRTSGQDTSGDPDLTDRQGGQIISGFLGGISARLIQARKVKFIFASGGECAGKLIASLDVDLIELVGEILPGLPFGRFYSKKLGRNLYFISKSGGFGTPRTLVEIAELMDQGSYGKDAGFPAGQER
jgi:uncharacterized protein YgbK (DUF1537 family)